MAITYGARSVGNIWISRDGGLTWTDVGRGLPPVPVASVAIDPTSAGTLYAGTEVGLFVTTDNGKTWSTTDAGPANVTVNQITWFSTQPRELLIATNGRGIWHGSVEAANPTPAISSLTPGTIAAGVATFTLTVSGSGFVTSSVVNWNGTALNTAFGSATQLQAQVPASMLVQGATVPVTVTRSISMISPNTAMTGSAATTLVVSGSNFVPTSIVQWNGTGLATTYVSTSTLHAQVPASDLLHAGSALVLVSNPAPGGGQSSAMTFKVLTPPSSGGGGALSWPALLLLAITTLFGSRRFRKITPANKSDKLLICIDHPLRYTGEPALSQTMRHSEQTLLRSLVCRGARAISKLAGMLL